MVMKKKKTKKATKKAPKTKGTKPPSSGKKIKKSDKMKTKTAKKSKSTTTKKPVKKKITKKKTDTKAKAKPKSKGSSVKKKEVSPVKKKSEKQSQAQKLTTKEKGDCRIMLHRKRALILGDLTKMESSALRASEQDPSVDNLADFGTDNYEQDFTLGLMENVEGVLKDIDNALERLGSGNFGICQECGCNIPKARLLAIPYARYCVACQSELEKK
jgi:RNA polymerase-binding transcription factor DksA